MALRNYTSKPTLTALAVSNGTLTAGATTAVLDSVANLPTAPFTAVWEHGSLTNEEVVLVTAVNTGTKTVTMTRGYDGTTGVSHNTGASFEHCTAAIDFTEANTHVNAGVSAGHGQVQTADIANNAVDQTKVASGYVDLASGQTVGGIKTFTTTPNLRGGNQAGAYGSNGTAGITLQNLTAATSGTPVQAPGTIVFQGHVWNGSADILGTAGSIGFTYTTAGGARRLIYTAEDHLFNGTLVMPRGTPINVDNGTANTIIQSEQTSATSFTGSVASDLIIKEPNGQRILIGTHGSGGVQNPTLRVESADVFINDNGTMRSAPRGCIGRAWLTGNVSGSNGVTTNTYTPTTGNVSTNGGGAAAGNLEIQVTVIAGRKYKAVLDGQGASSVAAAAIGYTIVGVAGTGAGAFDMTAITGNVWAGSAANTYGFHMEAWFTATTSGTYTFRVQHKHTAGAASTITLSDGTLISVYDAPGP